MSNASFSSLQKLLIPLQIFGFEFIFLTSHLKVNKKTKIFHFVISFAVAFSISSYNAISNYKEYEDISKGKNFLNYVLKILVYGGRCVVIDIGVIEAFLNLKSTMKIFEKSLLIQKLLKVEFLYEFSFESFKKSIYRKLMIFVVFSCLLRTSYIISDYHKPNVVFELSMRTVR
jgi:hypothetical protein